MPEYRPCIATEYVNKLSPSESLQCRIKVNPEEVKHNAIFHHWSERFWTIGQSSMIGRYAGGQMSQTVGIVEYEDGTIHEHTLNEIQFTDGMFEKFRKNKKDDWILLTEDLSSYPKTNEHVLFKTTDGRIFYGIYGENSGWLTEIEEGTVMIIKGVFEWRKI